MRGYEAEAHLSRAPSRPGQVGTGARSEKIRTYNWKDSRCTDHRLGTNFPLDKVLNGELDGVISACIALDQQEQLKAMAEEQAAG